MKLISKRFPEREFDVPEEMLCKTDDGLTIIRAQYFRDLIEEFGDTVALEKRVEPTAHPVYCVKVTIKDDAGVAVSSFGSVNIEQEDVIGAKFPIEKAESRGVPNAVIAYCRFEGRVYSDASIPMPDETASVEEPVETPPTEEKKPTSTNKPTAKAPAKFTPKPKAEEKEIGEFVVQIGNEWTKGKQLKELSESSLNWLAGLKPTSPAAKEAKEKAEAFLALNK